MVLDGIKGLDKALIEMNRGGVETLVLAGGDGTMQATFTDTINNDRFNRAPRYVALPCGMTNVIATDCGLPGSPASSLDSFLWRHDKGSVKTLQRPLLSARNGTKDPVHGFFIGGGAFYSAVKFSRESVQSMGAKRKTALALSVGSFVLKTALDQKNSVDDIEIEYLNNSENVSGATPSQLVFMATTLSKLGAGIFPFWGQGEGGMAVTSIDFPAKRILRAAPAMIRAKSRSWFDEYGYRSWRSDQLMMKTDGPFVFDGEFFEPDTSAPTILETSNRAEFLQ